MDRIDDIAYPYQALLYLDLLIFAQWGKTGENNNTAFPIAFKTKILSIQATINNYAYAVAIVWISARDLQSFSVGLSADLSAGQSKQVIDWIAIGI